MPKLPDLATQENQAPSAGMGIVSYSGATAQNDGSGIARAIAALGGNIREVGAHMQQEEERRSADAAEAAFNTVRGAQLQLTVGEDGYTKRAGSDAVDKPIHKEYLDKLDSIISGVSDTLQTPQAKERFQQLSSVARMQFSEGIMTHVMRQDEVANKSQFAATLKTEQDMARVNALDPAAVALSISRVTNAVDSQAERHGWKPYVRDAELKNQISGIHEAVIGSLISSGYDINAQQYYDSVKTSLSQDVFERLDPKMKAATTDGKAFRGANEIWDKVGPTSQNDPVRLFDMEREAGKMFANDPAAMKATVAEIRSRAQAFNAQQAEVAASNKASVLDMYNNGASLMSIKKSDQFRALSGTDQAALIEHITDRGYTLQQRAIADKEHASNPDAQAIYWTVRNSPKFDAMSDNEVLALQPHIGATLVNALMTEKSSPDRVNAIALDNQIVKDAYRNIGGSPDSKSDDDKAAMTRISMAAKQIIEEEQKGGKRLSYEEKAKIVQQVADRSVMMHRFFGKFGERSEKLVNVKPEERGKIFVPMDQIPKDQKNGLYELMVKRGKTGSFTEEEKARNIEKAYAIGLAGGTKQEIFDALDGN